jgi:hypothetical protein
LKDTPVLIASLTQFAHVHKRSRGAICVFTALAVVLTAVAPAEETNQGLQRLPGKYPAGIS